MFALALRNCIIAERLSARHIIRHYDVIQRFYLCMYVSHALECNFLRTSFTYFSNHVPYDACAQGYPDLASTVYLDQRPLPTPHGALNESRNNVNSRPGAANGDRRVQYELMLGGKRLDVTNNSGVVSSMELRELEHSPQLWHIINSQLSSSLTATVIKKSES